MRRFYLSVVDKPLVDTKRDLPKRTDPFTLFQSDNYSSTAAWAAANIWSIMLIINCLRLDWSTFELRFSCILHVLHVDVSYYFVRIFIILQNIQFFLQKYPFT